MQTKSIYYKVSYIMALFALLIVQETKLAHRNEAFCAVGSTTFAAQQRRCHTEFILTEVDISKMI